ncbi:MAG: hypothetical protein IT236_15245 [Bacteroidia bacterium]|nr:hypothetical protein [Bacteroidia bacterium]
MNHLDNKNLILSLIKDDLINTKLISGLENLGIDAGLYLLGISDAIFVLMGIDDGKKGEELFEYYLDLRDGKILRVDLKESYEAIDGLVLEIYDALIAKKLND